MKKGLIIFLSAALLGCISPSLHDANPPKTSSYPVSWKSPEVPFLQRLSNGHYVVLEPWTVTLKGKSWIIQRGYNSNGITAPAEVKKKLGDGVRHPETWAAVFHDWLFTQPGISRSKADSLFYDLLIAYKVPKTKAKLMYSVVSAYSISKTLR